MSSRKPSDGSAGEFVQAVWQMARDEQEEYVQAVLQEAGGAGAADVTKQELMRAFTLVDPCIGEGLHTGGPMVEGWTRV